MSYRDTAQVHPCSLILGVLPRKVPVRQYPLPSFNPTAVQWCIYQKPLSYDFAQSRGCAVPYFRTVRGRKPSIERHMDVLERVLK